jgi:acyl dehydratase
MPIDPNAIGAKTEPHIFEWTDRDTLLYALGVGAGTDDLAFTTENSHDIPQQVLPTYSVIACTGFAAAGKIGSFNFAMLLHGSQSIRLFEPLPAAGKLSVVGEVADIQDKGEGRNAVVMLKATGTNPDTGKVVAETMATAVIRGEGGFGGQPGQRPVAPEIPDREPDSQIALPTREDQALIYRLSGDRNPLHSDPWFVGELGGGEAGKVTAIASRFTSPVFPGETLTTSIWRTEPGHAVFRTEAANPDGSNARLVLEDGVVEYTD